MEVICIGEEAFYALINEVMQYVKANLPLTGDQWISDQEAMKRLRIKSKTTLQKLRDTGKIRFSQPHKKHIVYDGASIDAFFEKHARETF